MVDQHETIPADLTQKVADILERSKNETGLNEFMSLLNLSQESASVTMQLADNEQGPAFGQYAQNSN